MYHGLKQKHGKIQGVSMLPFGLVAGFAGEKEIRIIELAENGFTFRTAGKIADPELFRVCFYHYPKLEYEQVDLHSYTLECSGKYEFYYEYTLYLDNIGDMLDNMDDFDADETENGKSREYEGCKENREYVEYREQVQAMLLWYDRYIRLKLTGDENELASAMTVYPTNGDAVTAENFEEQKKRWFFRENEKASGNPQDTMGAEELRLLDNAEFALELNCTSLYEEYLCQPLQAFLASYWQKNYLTHSYFAGRIPDRFYIGNQFCHNLFPIEEQLFSIMDKVYSEGSEITLVFSYIREFMLLSVGKLLEKVDNWCCIHGVNVEIVVNDWAMVEMLCGKTSRLHPVLGTLLNKRKKDPRMKYKSGDTLLFQQNSLNAGFYRDFLAEEFHIHRYEWESCGYPQELPPGKNSLHLPFYQTNTSQYCPLYALCTTGDRGTQQLAEHCPKFCEKYTLLYPEHLHMAGRYNSLFGVDKTFPEIPEMWKNIKGTKPDRIVVNI